MSHTFIKTPCGFHCKMTFGPLCEIFNASIYVSTSKLISCRKCCVEILCKSAVVSVFCTICSTDFAFSMISSLSSTGGLDIKVFVAGSLRKPKWRFVSVTVVTMCMFL